MDIAGQAVLHVCLYADGTGLVQLNRALCDDGCPVGVELAQFVAEEGCIVAFAFGHRHLQQVIAWGLDNQRVAENGDVQCIITVFVGQCGISWQLQSLHTHTLQRFTRGIVRDDTADGLHLILLLRLLGYSAASRCFHLGGILLRYLVLCAGRCHSPYEQQAQHGAKSLFRK